MRRVLVLGENAVDVKIRLDDLILSDDENHIPEETSINFGGTGINFSFALKVLSETPVYFTPISLDAFGKSIRQFLEQNNIYYFDYSSEKPTPVVVSIISKDKRITIANIKGTAYVDITFNVFLNANLHYDYVYVSGGLLTERNPQIESFKIIKHIKEMGRAIFFDPQVRIGKDLPGFIETCEEIIPLSDIVLANEKEISVFGKDLLENFLERGGVLVVKRGKEGAKLITNVREHEVKGVSLKSVNVVGAGDVFNAAFIKSFINTNRLNESLEFANEFATRYVEKGFS
ncbi:carbohydrate kinase family protein [Caldisericum exile]|uniref:Carbohydrate kinase PfkB family protein n=1 Tax=Caldisericum exile (strain DSM 21853 / NBRC 104410 / AZM16c01) TaxID=511051 RepID=A0A7U6GEC0_CALEA|nr:carbohydrate kinase family protein [Caldisericum exile]BAL80828.1 carbohydrate kinase PfkB family protein [Caldisericum exile AZM16c01]